MYYMAGKVKKEAQKQKAQNKIVEINPNITIIKINGNRRKAGSSGFSLGKAHVTPALVYHLLVL